VRAVIAVSYERIHRSNLVGMGILPLEFPAGETWQSLGLTGEEIFEIPDLDDNVEPRGKLTVRAAGVGGTTKEFKATVRIDSPVERDYYRNGGILQTVLRKLLAEG
jgi:aconitate hydratase